MDNPPSVVQAKAPSPFTFLLLTSTLSDRPPGSPLRTDPESDHFLSRPSPHHLHPPLGSQGDLPHWPCFLCLGLSSLETQQSGVELPCQSTLPHTQHPGALPHTGTRRLHPITAVARSCLPLPFVPQSCWLTLPQHRRPHPAQLCFLSDSSQGPSDTCESLWLSPPSLAIPLLVSPLLEHSAVRHIELANLCAPCLLRNAHRGTSAPWQRGLISVPHCCVPSSENRAQ